MEFLGNIYIFWFILGLVFLILEVVTPGFFFVFFGAAAWLTLLLCFILPRVIFPSWLQWSVFCVTSVAALLIFRQKIVRFFKNRKTAKVDSLSEPMVAQRYLGQEVDVLEDIYPGRPGKVELNGTQWQGRSEVFIAKGSRARILELVDTTLYITITASPIPPPPKANPEDPA
ncbi:MAG: NfeD family protein [Deltaproteobacteria bacterium]|jgi:membrane protein implicated in regulation of membrane protease activity|nr:NfeD family protein [Deltaproteobacteria bacterium]